MKLTSFPKSNKVYVLSDLHGGLDGLLTLLEKVEPNSYVFILGDLFEKGERSLETLEFVMKLSEKEDIFVILGNNDERLISLFESEDEARLKRRLHNQRSIVYQMAKSLNLLDCETSIFKTLKDHFHKHLAFLKSLDTVIELEDFVFVHAGLDQDGVANSSFEAKIGLDNFYMLGHQLNSIVVCGHYPVAMYYLDRYDNSVLFDFEKKIICIDGGYGATNLGQLNMLEITKHEDGYSYQTYSWNPFKKMEVVGTQEGIRENRGLCWPHFDIEIIEKGNAFSIVRSLYNGDILRAKNELLDTSKKPARAIDDVPHNFLSVQPGEVVSIIFDGFEGFVLALKDGECGWIEKNIMKEIDEV